MLKPKYPHTIQVPAEIEAEFRALQADCGISFQAWVLGLMAKELGVEERTA